MGEDGFEDVIRILPRVIRQRDDGSVGDDVYGAVFPSEHDGSQLDLLDGSGNTAMTTESPIRTWSSSNRNATQPILYQRLRAQPERKAGNTETGQQRLDFEPQLHQNHDQREHQTANRESAKRRDNGRSALFRSGSRTSPGRCMMEVT